MLGEHIEEMAKVFKASGMPLDPDDIAAVVLDIACAQGLMTVEEASSDLAQKQTADEARYILGID